MEAVRFFFLPPSLPNSLPPSPPFSHRYSSQSIQILFDGGFCHRLLSSSSFVSFFALPTFVSPFSCTWLRPSPSAKGQHQALGPTDHQSVSPIFCRSLTLHLSLLKWYVEFSKPYPSPSASSLDPENPSSSRASASCRCVARVTERLSCAFIDLFDSITVHSVGHLLLDRLLTYLSFRAKSDAERHHHESKGR